MINRKGCGRNWSRSTLILYSTMSAKTVGNRVKPVGVSAENRTGHLVKRSPKRYRFSHLLSIVKCRLVVK
jgi:hypothetical protein